MPRPRKPAANLPPHIDPDRIPKGVYWSAAGRYWTVTETLPNGRPICTLFQASPQWRELSPSTRKDYTYSRQVLTSWPTRVRGQTVGQLPARGFSRPLVQRLVDAIAITGPSKAAHARRYLSRVWEWAANRGFVTGTNPAMGIDMPKERKRRRLPSPTAMAAIIQLAHQRGQRPPGTPGSGPAYLWAVAEIAYLCRLRGIEVVTLTDANATPEGLRTNRRKGSRDNIVSWTPRLQAAWQSPPIPMRPDQRPLVVSRDGHALRNKPAATAPSR